MGYNGQDNFLLNSATPAAGLTTLNIYGYLSPAVITAGGYAGSDDATKTFTIAGTAPIVTSLFGGTGDNEFVTGQDSTFSPYSADGPLSLAGIQGILNLDGNTNPLATNMTFLEDQTNLATTTAELGWTATPLTGQLYNYQLTGVGLSGTATISYNDLTQFAYTTSQGNDTVDVLATAAETTYDVNGSTGNNTYTIGNTTANFNLFGLNGHLDGATLANQINGPIAVNPDRGGGGANTFNLDASGDDALASTPAVVDNNNAGFTYGFGPFFGGGTIAGNTTFFNGFAPALVQYWYAGTGVFTAMTNVNVRASEGNDTIDVNATTANDGNTPNGGTTTIQGLGGNDVMVINGDGLSGNNSFQGDDDGGVSTPGNDTFFLNLAGNIGDNSVWGAGTTSLTINGDGNASANVDTDRNQLIINDTSGIGRNLNFAYQDNTGGDLDIMSDGGPNNGLGGGVSPIPVVVQSMQTVISNTGGNNTDHVTITGPGDDDQLTVAELPTATGDDASLLPTGTVAGHSITAFLDGTPYTNAPPTELNNATAGDTNLPGVAGGGAGPDLLINGLNGSVTLADPTNLGIPGQGNQAIVYGSSEGDLVDTNGAAPDIFGLGVGVLQAGFGTGNAYDTVNVNDGVSGSDAVWINNNLYGTLVPVALDQRRQLHPGWPGLCGAAAGLDRQRWRRGCSAGKWHRRRLLRHPVHQLQHPGQWQPAGADQRRWRAARRPAQRRLPGVDQRLQRRRFTTECDPQRPDAPGDSPFGVKYTSIERINLAGQRHRQHHRRRRRCRQQSERLLQGPWRPGSVQPAAGQQRRRPILAPDRRQLGPGDRRCRRRRDTKGRPEQRHLVLRRHAHQRLGRRRDRLRCTWQCHPGLHRSGRRQRPGHYALCRQHAGRLGH